MLKVTLLFRGRNGSVPLKGAMVTVASLADGSVVYSSDRPEDDSVLLCDAEYYYSLTEAGRAAHRLAPALSAGKSYLVTETAAPSSSITMEGIGGGVMTMTQGYGAVVGKRFHVMESEEHHDVVLRHSESAEQTFTDSQGNEMAGSPGLLSRIKIARGAPLAFARRAVESIRRSTAGAVRVATGSGRRRAGDGRIVGALSVSAMLLIAALYAWIAAPLVLVCAISLTGSGADGFGPQWASRNIIEYVTGGYLLDGWQAWTALSTAYPNLAPSPMGALACLAVPFLAIAAAAHLGLSRMVNRESEILASRPPAIDSGVNTNIHGSARLIEDRSEVMRTLDSSPAIQQPPGELAAYAGFMPESRPVRLAKEEARCVAQALDAVAGAFGRGGRAPRLKPPSPDGRPMFMSFDSHMALLGDTGAGKTRRYLLPLVVGIMSQNQSAIITDPKGEIHGLLSPYLRAIGKNVVVVDFSDPSRSARWNPLMPAVRLWEADRNKAAEIASEIVEQLIPRHQNEGNAKFFNDGARAKLKSAILYTVSDPKCPDSQKTIQTAARLDEAFGVPIDVPGKQGKRFVPYEEMLESLPGGPEHLAYAAYSGARNAKDEETKSFSSTLATFMQAFSDPAIEDLMSGDEVDFEKLATEPTALFLIIPSEKQAFNSLATMFLDQAYQRLVSFAKEGRGGMAGKLPLRVNFVCEELCSIAKWNGLSQIVNIGRGHGMRFFLVLQSKAIFDALYEEDGNAILANCGHIVFLKTNDVDVTERWLSAKLGTYTCESVSTTMSGSRFAPVLTRKSVSTSAVKREVLTTEELDRWTADDGAIILLDGHPVVVPMPDISEMPLSDVLGMGSDVENLRKIWNARRSLEPRAPAGAGRKWSPELKAGKEYTDDERRRERARFLTQLASSWCSRQPGSRRGPEGAGKGAAAAAAQFGARLVAVYSDEVPFARPYSDPRDLERPGARLEHFGTKREMDSFIQAKRAAYAAAAAPPRGPKDSFRPGEAGAPVAPAAPAQPGAAEEEGGIDLFQ